MHFLTQEAMKGNCCYVGLGEMFCVLRFGKKEIPAELLWFSNRVSRSAPLHPGQAQTSHSLFLGFPSNVCLKKRFCEKKNPLRNQVSGCLGEGSRSTGFKEVRDFLGAGVFCTLNMVVVIGV